VRNVARASRCPIHCLVSLQANETQWCLLEDSSRRTWVDCSQGMTVGRADLLSRDAKRELSLARGRSRRPPAWRSMSTLRRRPQFWRDDGSKGDCHREFLELRRQLDSIAVQRYGHRRAAGLHDLCSLYAIDRPDLKGEGMGRPSRRAGSSTVSTLANLAGDTRRRHLVAPTRTSLHRLRRDVHRAGRGRPQSGRIKMTLYRTSGDSPISLRSPPQEQASKSRCSSS